MPLIPNLWWTPLQSSGSISHQSWFSSKHHDGRGGIWNLVQTPQKNLKTRGEAEWVFKFVRGVWPPLSVVFSLYNTSTQISASIFQNLSQIPLRNHSVWKIRGVWLKHSLKIWKLTQNFEKNHSNCWCCGVNNKHHAAERWHLDLDLAFFSYNHGDNTTESAKVSVRDAIPREKCSFF